MVQAEVGKPCSGDEPKVGPAEGAGEIIVEVGGKELPSEAMHGDFGLSLLAVRIQLERLFFSSLTLSLSRPPMDCQTVTDKPRGVD